MNNEWRSHLRMLNDNAWSGIDVFPNKTKKLDSSIKRNTGFIKKLKQGINKDSKESLNKDIAEVSLEKYLSEIITTANEVLIKNSGKSEDVQAAVEIISGLHQRFNYDFTVPLMESFLFTFESPIDQLESEKDKVNRVNVLKANVRILTELYFTGICRGIDELNKNNLPSFIVKRYPKKEPILFLVLREVLNYKFKQGLTTPIASLLVKKYPELFSSEKTDLDEFIKEADLKMLLQSLFKIYTEIVFQQTTDLNKKTSKLMKDHHKAQIRTGKKTSEYLDEYEEVYPVFEKFMSTAFLLADAFKLEAPKIIAAEDDESEKDITSIITNGDNKDKLDKIWENEETRRFYETLPTIKTDLSTINPDSSTNADDVNRFFSDLEMVETKEAIDNLSQLYWKNNLDNKATRKRLLKFFMESKDWSKIRLYSRFIAINSETLPEVKDELLHHLDNGFRSQLHTNRINVKNINFFSEMVKFMLVPTFMIFHKIRTLIINVTVPNNIEILTTLLENFGRFLINKPEFKPQMEKMMDLIKEKKKDHLLTVNNKAALDNLLILIYPPLLNTLNKKHRELSPEEQFYRIIIRRELSNMPVQSVVKLILKASWDDPLIVKTFFSLFTKPEKVSYQSIPKLSNVLTLLYNYYKEFSVNVVDTVLENIVVGLEYGEYDMNVSRISQVKYLTELYNTSFIKFDVLLDTMYKIIRFGYPNAQPNPFFVNEGDLPDNYFRISLIATILQSIQRTTPSSTKKLDIFIQFFEYYVLCKDQPCPKEVAFKVENTFALFPGFDRSNDWFASLSKLTDLLKQSGVTAENADEYEDESEEDEEVEKIDILNEKGYDKDKNFESEENISSLDDESSNSDSNINESDLCDSQNDETDSSDDGEDEDDDTELSDSQNDETEDTEEEEEEEDDDDDDDDEDDDDDDEDYLIDREKERKRITEEYQLKLLDETERKAQDDFEKQFQSMMDESLDSLKNETLQSMNMPMHFSSQDNNNSTSAKPTGGKIPFTFLSRSGKKTQAHSINVPSDTKFVSEILEEEQRLKEERQKIKNIVMNRNFD